MHCTMTSGMPVSFLPHCTVCCLSVWLENRQYSSHCLPLYFPSASPCLHRLLSIFLLCQCSCLLFSCIHSMWWRCPSLLDNSCSGSLCSQYIYQGNISLHIPALCLRQPLS